MYKKHKCQICCIVRVRETVRRPQKSGANRSTQPRRPQLPPKYPTGAREERRQETPPLSAFPSSAARPRSSPSCRPTSPPLPPDSAAASPSLGAAPYPSASAGPAPRRFFPRRHLRGWFLTSKIWSSLSIRSAAALTCALTFHLRRLPAWILIWYQACICIFSSLSSGFWLRVSSIHRPAKNIA